MTTEALHQKAQRVEAAESALTRLVAAAQANLGEFTFGYSGVQGDFQEFVWFRLQVSSSAWGVEQDD